jgi:hypothetical protein
MKMVKSLLLGSAAGLVAVAGAQAADLPVKAKPVQYVKICSLYGVGFYYIPGTDMCIKIGGWVRTEAFYASGGNGTTSKINTQANTRATQWFGITARGYITADARDQTEYGTVRAYIAVGLNTNANAGNFNAANTFSSNRAFIQWAGFTFGLAQSFYDFYSTAAIAYWGDYPASDTGDPGWHVLGYTAQFGNGFSATLAAEDARRSQIISLDGVDVGGAFGLAGNGGTVGFAGFNCGGVAVVAANIAAVCQGAYGGAWAPDVVGNVRVDQAWGSAQLMGAWHLVNGGYYVAPAAAAAGGLPFNAVSQHPDNENGWALGAGLKLNAPMIGPGDYLQLQVNYTQGATRYAFRNPNNNWGIRNGAFESFGILADAVYAGTTAVGGAALANQTSLQLSTAWGVDAGYEHFWNPRWRTSLYGGYAQVNYGGLGNALLCASFGGGNAAFVGGVLVGATPGCSNDWNTWWLGSRTQWNVTKDFYMGLDVMYINLRGLSTFNGVTTAAIASGGTAVTPFLDNEHALEVKFRVHRDFYP